MTTAPLMSTPLARRVVYGDSPDSLAEIYEDDVNLAVWQRRSAPALIEECRRLLAEKGAAHHRLTLPASERCNLVEALPGLAAYPLLRADIQMLTEMFSCLFAPESVGLRLTPLTDAMCPKFHVDRVPCRLLTTYVGTGTDWLHHHNVDRSKLGTGSDGLSDAESGLYASSQMIQKLASGDVALLKGESWEGNEGAGLVHRSPAVAPGQQRLILTLDLI